MMADKENWLSVKSARKFAYVSKKLDHKQGSIFRWDDGWQ